MAPRSWQGHVFHGCPLPRGGYSGGALSRAALVVFCFTSCWQLKVTFPVQLKPGHTPVGCEALPHDSCFRHQYCFGLGTNTVVKFGFDIFHPGHWPQVLGFCLFLQEDEGKTGTFSNLT